jgi:hypothetical protein
MLLFTNCVSNAKCIIHVKCKSYAPVRIETTLLSILLVVVSILVVVVSQSSKYKSPEMPQSRSHIPQSIVRPSRVVASTHASHNKMSQRYCHGPNIA